MRRIYVFIITIAILLTIWMLATRVASPAGGKGDRKSTPTSTALDCCQCTALGKDQHYPFPKKPGYTCEEYCFRGCLERGYSEPVCQVGQVSGYALACPDVLLPTVTPFGR